MVALFARMFHIEAMVFNYLRDNPTVISIPPGALIQALWNRRPYSSSIANQVRDQAYKQLETELALYLSMASEQFCLLQSGITTAHHSVIEARRIHILHRKDVSGRTFIDLETNRSTPFCIFSWVSSPHTHASSIEVLETLAVACDHAEESNDRPLFYRSMMRLYAMDLIGDNP